MIVDMPAYNDPSLAEMFSQSGNSSWTDNYNWDNTVGGQDTSWTDNYNWDNTVGGMQLSDTPDNTYQWVDDAINDNSWYEDNSKEKGFLDEVWDWATSQQGTSVISGAVGGLLDMWGKDNGMGGPNLGFKPAGGSGGSGGPSAAELQDARYARHNASINAPVDMNVRRFKR